VYIFILMHVYIFILIDFICSFFLNLLERWVVLMSGVRLRGRWVVLMSGVRLRGRVVAFLFFKETDCGIRFPIFFFLQSGLWNPFFFF